MTSLTHGFTEWRVSLLASKISYSEKRIRKRGGMTRRQRDLLEFIRKYVNDYGISPSYEEMCVGIGLAGKAGIHRLVVGLRDRGFVDFQPSSARSVRLTSKAVGLG